MLTILSYTNKMSNNVNPWAVYQVICLVIISTLDLALTCYAISTGIAYEGNPILSAVTLQGIGLLKTVGLLALVYRFHMRPVVLNVVGLALVVVCVWNTLVIFISSL
jgi:hypothetical protein